MTSRRRYRCRYCGVTLNAWLPWAKAPNGALLFGHLGQDHPDQVGLYLERIRTEDITTGAAAAYAMVEDLPSPPDGHEPRGQPGPFSWSRATRAPRGGEADRPPKSAE